MPNAQFRTPAQLAHSSLTARRYGACKRSTTASRARREEISSTQESHISYTRGALGTGHVGHADMHQQCLSYGSSRGQACGAPLQKLSCHCVRASGLLVPFQADSQGHRRSFQHCCLMRSMPGKSDGCFQAVCSVGCGISSLHSTLKAGRGLPVCRGKLWAGAEAAATLVHAALGSVCAENGPEYSTNAWRPAKLGPCRRRRAVSPAHDLMTTPDRRAPSDIKCADWSRHL